MRLSPSELETIRQRPQQTQLHLSIFQPRIVLKALVNNVNATIGDRLVPFDSVSFGSINDVQSGMTMWVGSENGENDLGKIRIRSTSPSGMIVAENSDVDWENNAHLTVYRFWEVWPVFPRIINDPDNEEDVIFYKDYDIPYTNQNTILGSFVNAGPHRAVFLENGSAQVYYSSTGTCILHTGTNSYDWEFEGGNPSGSTLANPGYVSYNTPGHYVTRLTVSGSYGQTDTAYRYVSVYNPIASGTNLPYLQWSMEELSGSRDEGGNTTRITIYQNSETLQEGSVVVLFSDDWYGDTHISLGGNYPNASKIFFVGYIMEGSIEYDWEHSQVSFDVGSISAYLKEMEGFSVSVETSTNPTKWYHILDLDINKSIYHYLRWHSTVLTLHDVACVDTNPKLQFFDADRTSLFDAIDNFMRSTLVGKMVNDRQGKLWPQPDIYTYATGTFLSVMDVSNRDWMGVVNFDESMTRDLSYLERGGIYYSGVTTGTFSAMMACAPGNTPAYRGTAQREQGLGLLGRDHIRRIVKNEYAFKTYPFQSISMPMAGSYRNLDIAPQEAVHLRITPEDTVRRANVDLDYFPSDIRWEYDEKNHFLIPTVTFQPIINGNLVEDIVIPDTPDEGGYSVPPSQVPPFPGTGFPADFGVGMTIAVYESAASLVDATAFPAGRPGVFGMTPSFTKVYDPLGLVTLLGGGDFKLNVSGWYLTGVDISTTIVGGSISTFNTTWGVTPTTSQYAFSGGARIKITTNGGTGGGPETSPSKLTFIRLTDINAITASFSGGGGGALIAGTLRFTVMLVQRLIG